MNIILQEQQSSCQILLVNEISQIPTSVQNLCKKYFNKQENQVLWFPSTSVNYIIAIANKLEQNLYKQTEAIRILGHQVIQILEKEEIYYADFHHFSPQNAISLLEGALLSEYFFDKYKTDKTNKITRTLSVQNISEEDIDELQKVISSVNIARDLINEPVSYLNSVVLSQEITTLGTKFGFEVEVFDKAKIQSLGMGGLLGVNQGSETPPTFNILTWKPENTINQKPYILVGKGVVYDTGGYNVKPGAYMDQMKSDMSGAAAVIGTLCAIAQNKLPLYVVGLIPSTDNRINSNAIVSDDILKMYNGLTVEVKNTDAEGRLILADALAYAQQYNPELVIDLATLTGAAARVTSHYGSAFMGTASEKEKQILKEVGESVYERLIEFPFWDEFDDDIKSPIADIKNLGNLEGGASTAGKFLQRFTQYPWIHIDIAGSAFVTQPYKYFKIGATGVGIRLLYHFLKKKGLQK